MWFSSEETGIPIRMMETCRVNLSLELSPLRLPGS